MIDEDHYVFTVVYEAGRHTLNREQIGTRYVLAAIRMLVNPSDPKDVAQVNALHDAVKVDQPGGPGKFEVPNWDAASRKKVSDALAVLGSILPDWRGAAGHRNEVDPIRHLIVAATGWGLNPDKDAIYLNVTPSRNDGATIYKLNVKDVPVDGFWSVSLYNADGYYEKNPYDAYSLNNVTSKKNPDGSVTFGSMLAKMNRSNFFLVRPSKPVFRNQTRHSDLAKVPVENWIGYLSAYIIFGLEHRCLGKNLFDPRKTFFNSIGEKATRQHENVCCS